MRDLAAEVELTIKALGLAAPCVVDARLKFDRDRFGDSTFSLLSVSPCAANSTMHRVRGRLPKGTRRLINIRQVAELCGVSDETIKEFISAGQFPQHIQLEGAIVRLWWLHEIEAWRDARVRDDRFENSSLGGKRRPKRSKRENLNLGDRQGDDVKALREALRAMQRRLAELTATPTLVKSAAIKG